MKELLNAEWINDCNGKKDYDGRILSISTRYWKAGYGGLVFNTATPHLGLMEIKNDRPAEATSSLMITVKDDEGIDLITADFEGSSFEEVKTQVEVWAQEQMDRAVRVLKQEFGLEARDG